MSRINRSISIQNKFMFFFIIVAAVLSLTVGLLFLRNSSRTINLAKEEQLSTLSQETANKIERFLFERYGDIQVMARSPLLKNEGMSEDLTKEYLDSVRQAYRTYDYICIVDKTGKIRLSSGKIGTDVKWKEGLSTALNGQIYISSFIKNEMDGKRKVYFQAPIVRKNGEIIGAAIERMNVDAIDQIVQNVRIGGSGRAYLVSVKETEDPEEDQLMTSLRSEMQDQRVGVYYGKKSGQDILLAYTKIQATGMIDSPWYLVVEEPVKEAFKASYEFRNYLVMVLIVSITAVFILAYYMSKSIASPIKKLVKETRTIAEAGTTEKIKVEGNDEVSHLAESFNLVLGNMRDISAGMAHEIKNPLASIKGYAQYVKSEMPETDPLSEDMKIIISEVDRLNNILDRFLIFARPRAPIFQNSNLNETIDRLLTLYGKEHLNESIKVVRHFSEIPTLYIDQEQMGQVISNLVLNAIQAMPEGGTLEVFTRKPEGEEYVEIEVRDTGKGIPREEQERIFEPFFTTKDKGTGLGLAISMRIIENHKGTIFLVSEPGVGTSFILRLPINENKPSLIKKEEKTAAFVSETKPSEEKHD